MLKGDWRPTATLDVIKLRARILHDMRAFFRARGVLEVETPVLSSACASDRHIESLRSQVSGETAFLNTSPEFAMKRLLAAYGEPIYQVCKVFRDDELGPLHNPEFTMVEWYRPGFNMFELMDEVQDLIATVSRESVHCPNPGFDRISYRQAFENATGLNPHTANAAECRDCAEIHGIDCPIGLADDVDEWLDWLLTQLVLPAFPKDAYTFLYEYPASQCALAQKGVNRQGDAVANRFELVYGEIELANGYLELLDADEQRARFTDDNRARAASATRAAILDEHLLSALDHGLPNCSGVALGLDRLLMVIGEQLNIASVLTFSWKNA